MAAAEAAAAARAAAAAAARARCLFAAANCRAPRLPRSLPPSLARLQRPAEAPQQKLQAGGGGGVVQLYRYPGLTQSKAKTLLRKAQEKASSKIVGIDGELVSRHSAEACWH